MVLSYRRMKHPSSPPADPASGSKQPVSAVIFCTCKPAAVYIQILLPQSLYQKTADPQNPADTLPRNKTGITAPVGRIPPRCTRPKYVLTLMTNQSL